MISFSRVYKRYPQGYDALKDISFTIADGEMVFVTGHSGAGKSTLLKLIAAMERPTSGTEALGASESTGPEGAPLPFGSVPVPDARDTWQVRRADYEQVLDFYEREMPGPVRAGQRDERAIHLRKMARSHLRIEDQQHAVPTAKENVPAGFLREHRKSEHAHKELLDRREVLGIQATLQDSFRFHRAPR